jgi:hypothetical protein
MRSVKDLVSELLGFHYYITQFKRSESVIYRNTSVTNIRKYQIEVCTVVQ